MDETHSDGPPAKRRRMSVDPNDDSAVSRKGTVVAMAVEQPSFGESKEFEVGIQAHVNTAFTPFSAVLKKRYTDFLVNEILPDGTVLHLKNTRAPKQKQTKERDQPAPTTSQPTAPEEATVPAAKVESTQNKSEQNGEMNAKLEAGSNTVSDTDREKLVNYLNETAATEILQLYQSIHDHPNKKSKDHPTVRTGFTTDRSLRGEIHQFIRSTFNSRIESETDKDGVLILTAAHSNARGNQRGTTNGWSQNRSKHGKLSWLDRGGEYVHFTLFKENKDTMEAITWLTRQLKCNAKSFQFAGTKDRRAVTVQRCSAYRIEAERLAAQNQSLRNSKIGDFEYHPHGLELGDLDGNEFVITLRDCHFTNPDGTNLDLSAVKSDMELRMQSLRDNGYLNYYGQQRFGTFSTRTDVIGRHILREDFKAACDAILYYPPSNISLAQDMNSTIGQDDRNRILAISKWREDNILNNALDLLPRKFSAEIQLIRHLSRHPNDYFGALMTIQRNLRLMYVHAYQSLVWNLAASNRIARYGTQVIAGDLVLINEHKDKELPNPHNITTSTTTIDPYSNNEPTQDAEGDIILHPAETDRSTNADTLFERARPLTPSEITSQQYTIFDIVLPQPGWDILYPSNPSGDFYSTFMTSEDGGNLDPHNMRRKQRDFSLSGAYRKLVARIGEDWSVDVRGYRDDAEQFVRTDWDVIQQEGRENRAGREHQAVHNEHSSSNSTSNLTSNVPLESEQQDINANTADAQQLDQTTSSEAEKKTAVLLKFQLKSSQYATMALRELSRGGIVGWKTEYSGGR